MVPKQLLWKKINFWLSQPKPGQALKADYAIQGLIITVSP